MHVVWIDGPEQIPGIDHGELCSETGSIQILDYAENIIELQTEGVDHAEQPRLQKTQHQQ